MPTKNEARRRALIDAAFHEVMGQPPARVKQTRRTRGKKAAQKQAVAIALSKARKAGARIPRK